VNKPSKPEQIEALISWNLRELALRHTKMELIDNLGKKTLRIPYEKVLNVTRSEIKDYLKQHYSITDLVPPEPSERYPDNLFAEKIDNGYILYYRDYGRICDSEFIEDDDKLLDVFIKHCIDGNCTGYNFDKAPDNQDSGL